METGKFKLEAKQVDDWAKLLFDTLSRIALLSAFAVIGHREKLLWLLWVVGIAGVCLAYWIIFTLILRVRETRSPEDWKMASKTLRGRLWLAMLMMPVLAAIALAAYGSVEAIVGISKAQRTSTTLCSPSAR